MSPKSLDTVGELLNCRELIRVLSSVHYRDELTAINLKRLVEFHKSNKDGLATLAILNGLSSICLVC